MSNPGQPNAELPVRWRLQGEWLLAAAAGLLAAGLLAQWSPLLPRIAAAPCLLGSILISMIPVVPRAWRTLLRRRADMNLLMTIAVGGALAIGDWPEAATVAFLFSTAELIEARSVRRARGAIRGLMNAVPHTARVVSGPRTGELAVGEIAMGSVVEVPPGQAFPLDGIVKSGETWANEASITGESVPVAKTSGSKVFAGTLNGEGAVTFRVTSAAGTTVLDRIIHLVEQAQQHRAPSQRLVDRIAAVYTPAVMLLALGVMIIPPLAGAGGPLDWLYRGLVLLVIACPCALVISTPVAVVSAITALARRGILVKGRHP